MREGKGGQGGGGSVSWTHFKVIVLDMSFTEHPSNHINKGLDALGGWKEIWISHWCIILTHVLTWAFGTEDSWAQKRGPFCNKHSGMDRRWIPSYSKITIHTHRETDGRELMDAMNKLQLLQTLGRGSVCDNLALGRIWLIAGIYLNFTKTWQKQWGEKKSSAAEGPRRQQHERGS